MIGLAIPSYERFQVGGARVVAAALFALFFVGALVLAIVAVLRPRRRP